MAITAFALERSWKLEDGTYFEPIFAVPLTATICVLVAGWVSYRTRWRPGWSGAFGLLGAILAGYAVGIWLQYALAGPNAGFLDWYDAKTRAYHFVGKARGQEMGAVGYLHLGLLALASTVLIWGGSRRPFCVKCRRLMRTRILEYIPVGIGEPSFAPTSKTSAVEARLGEIARVLPPEGRRPRRPSDPEFVRVSHDLCESCGDSFLRADWMKRVGKGFRVVRTRRVPLAS